MDNETETNPKSFHEKFQEKLNYPYLLCHYFF